jgi:hypothetical protein
MASTSTTLRFLDCGLQEVIVDVATGTISTHWLRPINPRDLSEGTTTVSKTYYMQGPDGELLQQFVVNVADHSITESWLPKDKDVFVSQEGAPAKTRSSSSKDIAKWKKEAKKDEAKKHVGKMIKKPAGK